MRNQLSFWNRLGGLGALACISIALIAKSTLLILLGSSAWWLLLRPELSLANVAVIIWSLWFADPARSPRYVGGALRILASIDTLFIFIFIAVGTITPAGRL